MYRQSIISQAPLLRLLPTRNSSCPARHQTRNTLPILLALSLIFGLARPALAAPDPMSDLAELSIEELMTVEVTTVARKPQKMAEAAAAVYVISQEDIQRSGVTSIPEALRLAPGVQVARLDSSRWAISIRGFNAQFTNKLLVLIDGRSVYTPSYSGVYWDAQDTLLDDIERIEVIRGPGATMWGANAVNGIINIITKNSADSQGGLVKLGGGNEEEGFTALRYGGHISPTTTARIYGKFANHDSFNDYLRDQNAGDDWNHLQSGFRLDGERQQGRSWTLQGDIYRNNENQRIADTQPLHTEDATATGWNILGRWQQELSDTSSTRLQLYYDHAKREETLVGQRHDTLDLDFQHSLQLAHDHDLVWGLGYRLVSDDFDNTSHVELQPDHDTLATINLFIQDDITLFTDSAHLILGAKFEHNDFTGLEVQPTARLLWSPHEHHSLWAAVSRAVRTPSRVEHDAIIPTPSSGTTLAIYGNKDIESENIIAYEIGYRAQASKTISCDLALFYNVYKNLQSFESELIALSPPQIILNFANQMEGRGYGGELSLEWQAQDWWQLQAHYSYIWLDIEPEEQTSFDTYSEAVLEGSSPTYQISLRSSMNLGLGWHFDLWGYYTDSLSATSSPALSQGQSIASYTSVNSRLAWQARADLEFSLVGHNLLDNRHLEFIGESFIAPTEIERSIYGQVRWTF